MSIISDAKDLAGLIKQIGDIELYQKILDLQSSILELSEVNYQLTDENKSLKIKLNTSEKMIFKNGLYYQENDEIPFCQKCWEKDKIAIHLSLINKGHYHCKNCDSYYFTNDYEEPELPYASESY